MDIILKSDILKVKSINKNTRAKVFGDLEVGSKIKLSIPVKRAGINKGTYASYIKVKNIKTGSETRKSFNQITKYLKCFEFEKVN